MISLKAFEREVRAFLRRSAPGPLEHLDPLSAAKRWQHVRHEAGLGWITGPAAYGGRELSVDHDRLYRRVEGEFAVPSLAPLQFGLDIVGSVLLRYGSDEAREDYLNGLFSGAMSACQLFSEPAAGSDLAAVSATAVRDGDGWVINGQKVWTSDAHTADIGEAVCRTDVDVPKHRGITIFIVDMRARGVDIRPITNAAGDRHFNEVFLNDVRVHDRDRVGDINDGWRVLNTSLMNERAYVGDLNETDDLYRPEELLELLAAKGALDDSAIRQGIADLLVRFDAARTYTAHARRAIERGETPGPEMSIGKLSVSDNQVRLVDFAATALGLEMVAGGADDDAFEWADALIRGRAMRIAGGTDEIQRTLIGERVLGLPRDPAIDNGVPFRDIAHGPPRRA